jgi:hypothetical protein
MISTVRKALGLAMIAAGISCAAVQLADGRSPALSPQTSPAASPLTDVPRIENAKLETHAAGSNLEATIRELGGKSEKPAWVGYSVDKVTGERSVCCNNNWTDGNCGTCRLESDSRGTNGTTYSEGSVKLEGLQQLVVLIRLEAKQINKIRVTSADCTLDAGGLTFVWLTGIKPSESVALLTTYVRGSDFQDRGDHSIAHAALTAIALHADASADSALENFVKPEAPEGLRRQTAFWMGAARGKSGLVALQRMAKSDPSSDVRAHVAFGLSVSHEPAALDEMIRMAHDDASSHVRGQALFWLAQTAGKKAVGTITGAIENDPDTDVKKDQPQSRRSKASHVLAGTIQRPTGSAVFRESSEPVKRASATSLPVAPALPSSCPDTSR